MSIDISQFLDTFYEESFEGLDIMESELLRLDPNNIDADTINTIFRAAHSIKGGSGTFGLNAVSDFTHVLETLLDEVRNCSRTIVQSNVDLMLTSVDVLRDMLTALKDSSELDTDRITTVHDQLEALLAGTADAAPATTEDAKIINEEKSGYGRWDISFKPHLEMFMTGNDPVRLLNELNEMGKISAIADVSNIPDFYSINPEDSYIAWKISYEGEATEEQLIDVFSWVEDECDLVIERCVSDNVDASEIEPQIIAIEVDASAAEMTGAAGTGEEKKNVAAVDSTAAKKQSGDAGSIRVGIDKIDTLINMVGELVITQSMLNELGDDFTMDKVESLKAGLVELERHTREMQENVMKIRMLPISFAFNRFPRLVHDLSTKLDKIIDLKMTGENTELDKIVMEKIGDPLVHLVRNSLDHGIETPAERVEAGKPETGTIHLNAYHQGGNIVIDIIDDGAGLNSDRIFAKAVEKGLVSESDTLSSAQINDLIFQPGFSTAEVVSDVSGRGVGMDVVRRNITDLGGAVEVTSEAGVGSKFTIRLPLTLAILDGQLVKLGDQTFVIPLVSIIESLQIRKEAVNSIAGDTELYKLRDEYVPIVRLHEIFGTNSDHVDLVGGLLVVVEGDGVMAGISVDDLLGQQQVVIKSLETNFKKVDGLSGATILGDGTVALILDVPGLVKLAKDKAASVVNAAQVA